MCIYIHINTLCIVATRASVSLGASRLCAALKTWHHCIVARHRHVVQRAARASKLPFPPPRGFKLSICLASLPELQNRCFAQLGWARNLRFAELGPGNHRFRYAGASKAPGIHRTRASKSAVSLSSGSPGPQNCPFAQRGGKLEIAVSPNSDIEINRFA